MDNLKGDRLFMMNLDCIYRVEDEEDDENEEETDNDDDGS